MVDLKLPVYIVVSTGLKQLPNHFKFSARNY